MASVKYGAMIPDLAGKVGGQNFQRGLASPIIRNISTKRKFIQYPQLAPQNANHRGLLAYASQSWKNISSTQRSNWSAATASFPRTNKFGNVYTPSGFQLFCEFSMGLLIAHLDIINDAPAVSTFIAPTWAVVYDSMANTITISQSVLYTASPYKTFITASYYQSNGKGLRKGQLKTIGLHQFTIIAPSLDITSNITSLFGAFISGTTMFFSVKQINTGTGEMNEPIYLSVAF